jgi:hypothetical protein
MAEAHVSDAPATANSSLEFPDLFETDIIIAPDE